MTIRSYLSGNHFHFGTNDALDNRHYRAQQLREFGLSSSREPPFGHQWPNCFGLSTEDTTEGRACDSTQEELKESIELDELIRERGAEANPREKIANKLRNVLVNVGV